MLGDKRISKVFENAHIKNTFLFFAIKIETHSDIGIGKNHKKKFEICSMIKKTILLYFVLIEN
jgi:hypothetical protein